MKALLSPLLLLLLTSCLSSMSVTRDVKVPVDDVSMVTHWASLLPRFDVDQNGYLDAQEVDQYLIYIAFQIMNTYAVQPPELSPEEAPNAGA